MMITRYFLEDKGGYKVSSSLTPKQRKMMADHFIRQGMKEVTKKEWFAAKKKWEPEEEYPTQPQEG